MNLAFWKRKKPADDETEAVDPPARAHEPEERGPRAEGDDEPPPPMRVHLTKKRLILGAIGGFVILLVVGIGILAWRLLAPKPAAAPAKPAAQAAKPAAPDREAQRQLEALKKKNAELAAEVEALKKEKAPETASPVPPETPNAAAGQGDVVLSGKDPKAAAQALKKAIEEMNAESADKPIQSHR